MDQRLSALRTRMRKSYQDKLEGKIDEKFWSLNMNDWSEEERQLEAGLETMSEPCADDPVLSAQKNLKNPRKTLIPFILREMTLKGVNF